ncbi:hypothetical protein TPEGhana051_0553 [Treponema pallidum subsp. pertenue]|uniref:AI-2E family transporter n=1 Tax=Treponema pallidum TaxID=160 RepID=UPI000BA7C700|nr:AI-2E family transporter [Treponema pallidum]ASV58208.1 hypothetical protein TPEGhana051_0553 [Treponema pallidum subsp. pertenue]ASV59271.1 hypothetical protein TPECDC2575_0553 [Treponema pallidum subsp. pertenue]AZN66438.1 hypothetical protein TPECDC1_0553 [Treponema pallidum subsp. pertenue]
MEKQSPAQTISLFVLLALMFVLVCMLFVPYLTVLLWSSILAILLSPCYRALCARIDMHAFTRTRHLVSHMNGEDGCTAAITRATRFQKKMLAAVFSLVITLLVTTVFFFIAISLFGQGKLLFDKLSLFFREYDLFEGAKQRSFTALIFKLSRGTVDISTLNVEEHLLRFFGKHVESVFVYTQIFVKNIARAALSTLFFSFTLYFFFLDGEHLSCLLIAALPLRKRASAQLLEKCKEATRHLFKGLFSIAFYQTCVAFVFYGIFRVEGPMALAMLTFFASFLPLVGCACVWLPVGISIGFTSGWMRGTLFLFVAGSSITIIDSFLRPLLLQNKMRIHPLLIFFSMLGGVQTFGFNGMVLGPILVILLFTVIDLTHDGESHYTSIFHDLPAAGVHAQSIHRQGKK